MAENRELALVLRLVASQFQDELKKSGGLLGEFNRFVSDWKTQLVAAGGALFAIAKSTANYGEELLKTSQKVGVTVEALAGLQHAANLADLSHEQLAQGLKFLSVNMVEASRQTGDGEALFRRLGVAATDATGKLRPTEQVLLDVADAFAHSKDGAGKAEVAVKLFGKAGLDLIPFLNQGKAGIAELMAEAQRLGLVLSKEDAEAANRFNDELKKLQGTMRGLVLEGGKPLVGVLTELMETFRALTSNEGVKFFFKGLAEQAVLFSTTVQEAAANVQFLFGKFSFEQLKTEIKRLEAGAEAKLLLLENPNAAAFLDGGTNTGPAGAAGEKPELAQLADQEKLAKALVEIWATGNRALEIRNKLVRESAEGLSVEFLAFDRQEQFRKEDEAAEERRGRLIVEQTALEVQIRERALADEREGLIANEQAWIAYYDQLGGSTEGLYAHKTELLLAQLAKELDLTKAQSTELLQAWQDRDSARAEAILAVSPVSEMQKVTIELNTMREAVLNARQANGSFFEGWAVGMRNYVQQTGNGFNLATDMARTTAQAMESGFRTFFFDVMDHKIQTLKDVFRSLLGFVKQIIATITAQLVTSQILRLVTSFGPGASGIGTPSSGSSAIAAALGGSTGGQVRQRFAMGGPVPGFGTSDTVPALLTPGEFVLSRNDVSDVKRGLSGRSPINIAITVNATGDRQQTGTGAAPNFTQLARDLSRLVEAKLIDEQRPGGLLAGTT